MTATIQLAIDAGYRERKAEEFERAKAGAISAGVPVATRPPVGYRQRADRRLEPDPASAPVVAELFAKRAAGAGPAELAEHLEARGVTTSLGSSTWSKQAIYGMLANRVYLGELSYGRDGRFSNPTAHEPIVDLATWTAAQRPATTGPSRLARAAGTSTWLVSGLVRCHACRYAMQGTTTARKKRIYRCTRRHAGGLCPAPARVDADRLEVDITHAFWALVDVAEARGRAPAPDDREALRTALERAELRLAQVETEDAQDALGVRWTTVVRERRSARDDAAAALGHAESRASVDLAPVRASTLRDLWETGTTQERRALLSSQIDTAAVRRDPYGVDVYPAGSAPGDLPRRGYVTAPTLRPFPDR